ncbi:MAG: GAF domain-containing protein [Frankiales bacterium]|nr:GAF domain-containing protein [Frankiales bacterium]
MTLPLELDDPVRLQAVADLHLVGAAYEERFDRVTRTARLLLDVPLSFLNLLTGDTLWVTSCVGLDERRVDRDIAFCSHALGSAGTLTVRDTLLDARFAKNPMVVGEPGIRAYAGHPLRGPTGHLVGTLCVMDTAPRDWSAQELASLRDLAAWAEQELARGDVDARLAQGARVQQQYEQVLTSAGQGILGLDAEGVIVVANPAADHLTGWAAHGGLVGHRLHETLHPIAGDGAPCRDDHCAIGRAALLGDRVLRNRDVLLRHDASTVAVQVSSAPIFEAGEVTGAVVVVDDITDQLAVERLKNEFVSVVSHELRTPLTSLRGSLGLLASGVLGELSAPGKQMADVALSSTERLVRLVDEILDLERLAAGQVVLQRRQHALVDVVQTAVQEVAGLAEQAGVVLRADVDGSDVWLDADRVVQVLVNLLGNAVKFSPSGAEVAVRANVSEGMIVVAVEDSGRGIPDNELERIFDRFAQVDASDSRDHGGSGLGLAIARNVVEAHGGTITARSVVGEGTTFTVTIPQRRPDVSQRPNGRRCTDTGINT